jgi:hypothetical protein
MGAPGIARGGPEARCGSQSQRGGFSMTRTSSGAADRRAPISEWRVGALRLTTFHRPDVLLNAQGANDWWQRVAGNPPEDRFSKPVTGEQSDGGRFGDGSLFMQVQPQALRVDWLFQESPDAVQTGETLFNERLVAFDPAAARWLEICPPVQRIAFGALALLPVDDRSAGYDRICNYLIFDVNADTSSDFNFRINRTRESTASQGLRINRVSQWSVGVFNRYTLRVSPQGLEQLPLPQRSRYHLRLELDINTDYARDTDLESSALPRIFRELVYLAQEIVREGDL